MPGRLLLVIGSNWGARPPLSFLPGEARNLYESLLSPQPGQCEPALPGRSLVLDPGAAQLDTAIEEAFAAASAQEATLVLAFTGHGVTSGDDYYLLAADSPEDPDSRTAYLLGQRVKELFRRYSAIDGLVLLLDTCESGRAAEAAGRAWIDVLSRAERRFELLTATGDGPAFGGCFVKSLTYLIRNGTVSGPDRLGCAEVRDPVNQMCAHQQARHVAFTGTAPGSGDPTLWLARNAAVADRHAPLDGSVLAGVAALAARSFQPTRSYRRLRELVGAGAHVAVVGPAGSGKTAVLTALAQPRGLPRVQAAWLGQTGESVEQIAGELAAQLTRTVDGFPAAAETYLDAVSGEEWSRADAVERMLTGPLQHLGDRVLFVIDSTKPEVLSRIARPLAMLPHVQVVAGAYEPDDLGDGFTPLPLEPATRQDVAGYVARRGLPGEVTDELFRGSGGNWMAITARAEQKTTSAGPPPAPGAAGFHAAAIERALGRSTLGQEDATAVLAVLAAAGTGPAMPFRVLRGAVARLGGTRSVPRLHEVIARLDTLVVHGHTDTGGDHYGLRYQTVADYVWDQAPGGIGREQAHAAVAEAIEEAAPMAEHQADDSVHAYAARSEAEHLWQAGRHDDAYACLVLRESLINAENLASWTTWTKRISRDLGDTHPLAFRAAGRQARALGETGDPGQAVELLRELAADSRAVLGPDDRTTLELEDHLAYWTHQAGDVPAAREQFSVLAGRCAVLLGADDPQTLMARHHLALMTAKDEDIPTALALWHEVLESRERVLGPEHIDTLRTRLNILVWTAKTGTPPPISKGSLAFTTFCETLSGRITPKRSPSATFAPTGAARPARRRTCARHWPNSPSCYPGPSGCTARKASGPTRSATTRRLSGPVSDSRDRTRPRP
ncbi:tetratricopeptide repeat protein [Amycolatopsis sp. NEAU-NG30]|uniref:Tetratricopeptide repeat protein n=1 Tax=Amycolatopsis melonis TaxID=3156488 RepID=A0ABV0LSF1_9PSEU